MAERKVPGNDVLLFVGTDGITYDTIVCLTSNGIQGQQAKLKPTQNAALTSCLERKQTAFRLKGKY